MKLRVQHGHTRANVMINRIILIALLIGVVPFLSFAQSENSDNFSTFCLSFENDTFIGTDRYYTGGFKLGWMSNDLKDYRHKPLLKWLPFVNNEEFQHAIFVSLRQAVYTPDDITQIELIEDDRPYAGILYLSVGIHSIGQRWMETWEFNLGVIGPHSYAEQSQKLIHKIFNGDTPKGWRHQLKDELAMELIYERKWKLFRTESSKGLGFDLIPHFGTGLGNVYIYASTGTQIRFGWNLPDDFGPFIIRPGGDRNFGLKRRGRFGIHVFAGVDGKAIARNIFLDGNTIRDSHRVDKRPYSLDIMLGLGMRVGQFNISYAFVFWTKRFKTEANEHVFGAVNLAFSY